MAQIFPSLYSDQHADMSWTARALCGQEDPEEFFARPGDRGEAALIRIEHAKSVCSMCEVRPDCLQEAFENNEIFGVWGGVNFENPYERNRAYRANGRTRKPRRKKAATEEE